MKNFKKVLALVLAVATLMSFATIASALTTSASYKDAAAIEKNGQTEAVDVLSAIGVLTGYPDTNFKPDQDITRAEAAKIIAMFDNGSVDISSLYTSANPFVDAKGNWAESYIAYGYKAGIIAGVGKLNFAPNAKLTGVQFLKMLLVVLGYDAKTEGLEGTSWAVNTLYLAKRIGLLDGLDSKFDASANLLRGQAAQIMLNVLKANMVEYGQAFKFTDAQKQLIDKYGVLKDGTYNYITVAGAVDTGKPFMTVWNLSCNDLDDAFMRPGHKWTVKSGNVVKSIGTYWDTPVATYTTKTSECTMLIDAGYPKTDTTTVYAKEYLNGAAVDATTASRTYYTNPTSAEIAETAAYNVYNLTFGHTTNASCEKVTLNTAQGTLTEVYAMGTDAKGVSLYRIVEIETYLAKVSNRTVTKAADGHTGDTTVTLTLYTAAAGTANETLGYVTGTSRPVSPVSDVTSTVVNGYSSDTLVNNDMVLVTYSLKDAAIESAVLAKSTTDTLNGCTTNTDPTTTRIGGNTGTPNAAKFYLNYKNSEADAAATVNSGSKFVFYYDSYGNVIGMVKETTTKVYTVIDAINYNAPAAASTTVKADLYGIDAKLVDDAPVTGMTDTATKTSTWTATKLTHNWASFAAFRSDLDIKVENNTDFYDKLYTYIVDANGNYKLTWVDDETAPAVMDGQTIVTPADTTYDATLYGTIRIAANDPNVYYKQNYTLLEPTAGTTERTIPTNEYTQYLIHDANGYQALTGYRNTDLTLTASYAEVVMGDNGYASIVYIYKNVMRANQKSTGYVADAQPKSTLTVNGTLYYEYTAYIDGKATTIYNTSDNPFTTNGTGLYDFQFETTKDNVVVFKADKTTEVAANRIYQVVSCVDNSLIVTAQTGKGYNVAADATVYVVSNGTVTAGTIKDNVVKDAFIKVIYDASSKTIKTIYVVSANDAGNTTIAPEMATAIDGTTIA